MPDCTFRRIHRPSTHSDRESTTESAPDRFEQNHPAREYRHPQVSGRRHHRFATHTRTCPRNRPRLQALGAPPKRPADSMRRRNPLRQARVLRRDRRSGTPLAESGKERRLGACPDARPRHCVCASSPRHLPIAAGIVLASESRIISASAESCSGGMIWTRIQPPHPPRIGERGRPRRSGRTMVLPPSLG